MGAFFRKYATATATGTHIGIPMVKAGSNDFATGSDWTPATGDVKLSLDGGAQANIGTLPAYTNGQWIFQFTGAELTAKSIRMVVVDSATKAVEDQFVVIETFGHASAMYPADFSSATFDANIVKYLGTTVATPPAGPGRASAAMVLGTVLASPSPTTTTLSASVDIVPTVADQFKGRILAFAADTTTAALRGQFTDITASTAPGSGNAGLTFTALTNAPATGDTFVIL